MKRLLVAVFTVGVGVPVGVATAADLPPPVAAPLVAVTPAYSWTGLYLGANVGYGGGDFDYPITLYSGALPASNTLSVSSSGFFGGGQVGYNYQFLNNVVIGAEADFQWSGIDGELDGFGTVLIAPAPLGGSILNTSSELDWFGTLRGRIGYAAWDSVLIYATGGGAYGKVKSTVSLSDPGGAFAGSLSADEVQWGWTAGGGAEFAFTPNWSFKVEYLYVDLGSQSIFTGPIAGLPVAGSMEVETKFSTIKAGVNYKF